MESRAPSTPAPRAGAVTSTGRSRGRRIAAGVAALALLVAGSVSGYKYYSRTAERREALRLAEKGPPDQALAALLRSLERYPDDGELLQAIAEMHVKLGAPVADVEPYTERWCRAHPNDPSAFRAHLAVLRRLERHADAVATGERVLAIDPNDETTRMTVAEIYLSLGRYADAAREYRHILGIRPDAAGDLTLALARAEWEQGNQAEAVRLTESVLHQNGGHSGALVLRGLIHFRAGEYDRTLAVFGRVDPTDPQAQSEILLYHRGQALDRLGRSDEAKRVYATLAALQNAARFTTDARQRPGDFTLHVRAAEAWLAADRPDAARGLIADALARLGPNRAALLALAACHEAEGNPDAAKRARAEAERAP